MTSAMAWRVPASAPSVDRGTSRRSPGSARRTARWPTEVPRVAASAARRLHVAASSRRAGEKRRASLVRRRAARPGNEGEVRTTERRADERSPATASSLTTTTAVAVDPTRREEALMGGPASKSAERKEEAAPSTAATPAVGGAQGRTDGLTVAGVPLTPEVTAIVLVYFVQGILGLSRLAKEYFVKDELGLGPAEASLIFSASSIPWLVKPLWGFISDSVPLFGYRRKSYLVACGALGALAGFALCTAVRDVPGAAVAFTMGSLSTAFSDVVIDSLVVARARGESQELSGSLQSLCWGSVALGGILSSYFSGSLIEEHGTRYVFGVTALFPLLIAGAALLVKEAPVRSSADAMETSRTETEGAEGVVGDVGEEREGGDGVVRVRGELIALGKKLWSVGKQRRIWAPTAFVFLWQATPNPGQAMFYFTTNELGFTPEFLGRVALARSVASLAGVGLYNAYLKKVPLKKMFTWSAVVGTVLGMSQLLLVSGYNRQLGISDQFFSLGDTVVLTVLGEVSFLPVLVLAAKVCPEGVEATLFAALMSIFNAGGVASGALGAALTSYLGVESDNFDNLFTLVFLCNLSSLAPLLGLGWLDEADKPEDGDGGSGEGIVDALPEATTKSL